MGERFNVLRTVEIIGALERAEKAEAIAAGLMERIEKAEAESAALREQRDRVKALVAKWKSLPGEWDDVAAEGFLLELDAVLERGTDG